MMMECRKATKQWMRLVWILSLMIVSFSTYMKYEQIKDLFLSARGETSMPTVIAAVSNDSNESDLVLEVSHKNHNGAPTSNLSAPRGGEKSEEAEAGENFHDNTPSKQQQPLWTHHGGSILEPTKWLDLFFPLRNVCFSHVKGHRQLHFFQAINDTSQSGKAAYDYYAQNHTKQEIFMSWTQPKHYFDPTATLHWNVTMTEWAAHAKNKLGIQVKSYPGTSFVVPPHLPHNQFHLFNDLLVPLYRDALLSGDSSTKTSTKNNDNQQNAQHQKRNLFLLRGNPEFTKKRVIMYDVLYQLFDTVGSPFEQEFVSTTTTSNSKQPQQQLVCFDRFVWPQSARRPFYDHFGRFDSTKHSAWKGVVPALRDAINHAYNITVPDRSVVLKRRRQEQERSKGEDNSNNITTMKPRLIWASRTNGKEASCTRCIVNERDLLEALNEKFDVELLPIADRTKSRQANLVQALELMARADILGGLHGAGLGHSIFLQQGTAVFELRDDEHFNKNLFMNMANHVDAAYYAFDTRPFDVHPGNKRERFVLGPTPIAAIVDGLWQGWKREEDRYVSLVQNETSLANFEEREPNCHFPLQNLSGMVSPFHASRCYLMPTSYGTWKQAVEFHGPFANQ